MATIVMEFKEEGTFQSYYKACAWLDENGYSYGSMCGDMPIGIMKGDWVIAKWRNLTSKEKKELDGVIESDDFREGSVKITIYDVTVL